MTIFQNVPPPIPPPAPPGLPIDSGIYLLMFLAVFYGGYFISKKQKKIKLNYKL